MTRIKAAAVDGRRAVQRETDLMGALRGVYIIAGMVVITLPLMPMQVLFRRFWNRGAELLPYYYHRTVCRLLGARIDIRGEPIRKGGCLIAANHSSWLDIPILSACTPVSFVAKSEVNEWGIFGVLARLQRTMFVNRQKRSATGAFRDAMQDRLSRGHHLVLFAEGTSSDGNRVLPFKSALLGAADCEIESTRGERSKVRVQPVSIVYTRLHSVPLGRLHRPFFAWYGDMELLSHLWSALCLGPIDVVAHFHEPVTMDQFTSRKELARHCERDVANGHVSALLGRPVNAG